MRRTYLAIGALALIALVAIAGCGGGGSSSSASTSSSNSASSSSGGEAETTSSGGGATKGVVVKVMNTPKLGKVIVDSEGMTMYDFRKDKGTTSSCYGACAEAWPPLLTEGEPTAMGGAEASLLGTTQRKDGTMQVTYNGHPLYGFVEDQKPGETTGNGVDGFGALWYALEPSGEEARNS